MLDLGLMDRNGDGCPVIEGGFFQFRDDIPAPIVGTVERRMRFGSVGPEQAGCNSRLACQMCDRQRGRIAADNHQPPRRLMRLYEAQRFSRILQTRRTVVGRNRADRAIASAN